MKRILVVTVNWLGDAVLTTPVFKALKETFPESYVAVLAVERVRQVYENNPYIDEIITFNDRTFKKSVFKKIRLAIKLRKKKFDTAFLIHRSFSRAFVCWLVGIKERIGYERKKNTFVLTKKIKPPQETVHRQKYYLNLFEQSGVEIKDKLPQFFTTLSAEKRMNSFLHVIKEKHEFIIGMNPSANWDLKRWPAQNFAKLADQLIENFSCAVIFTGAKKDKAIVDEVIKNMNKPFYNLCGKTDLKELAAIMENMNVFISNDSGPAHLAAALGINTLVIFGPTSSQITSPQGKKVNIFQKDISCEIPCHKLSCQDNICMKNITVDEVFLEVRNLLPK
jgi:heptosyltransferase-2